MCLLAPRLVEENSRYHALTGTAKGSKIRTQSLKMFVAPTLNLIVAAYGIRLLPEVEVEFLLCYRRQRVAVDIDCESKALHYLIILVNHLKSSCILASLNVARNLNCTPYRACLHCRNCMRLVLVNDIGNKPLRQCHRMVAASHIIISDYIVHEACIATVDTCCSTGLLPLGHAHLQHTLVTLAVENSLDISTLALPCMNFCRILLCYLWNLVQ